MNRLLPFLLAGTVLAGPALAQDKPKPTPLLTMALNADIRSLEPGINRDANTDTVVHHIYEGLVGYQLDLDVGPALAESWTVEDDGKTYRFTLRDGVKFHNGAPLTSAEVKSSWDRQFNNPAWSCKRFFDSSAGIKVLAVEAPDPRTIVYRLEAPSGLFLKQLANFQCAVVAAHPDSFDAEGKFKTPIGTGPYKLKDWKRSESISLERFADYKPSPAPASAYAGARNAYADQLVFRVVPDPSAAEAALVTGAIDILPNLEEQQVEPLRAKGIDVQTTPGLSWTTMLIQIKDPVLSNVKIRQAIAHAIDLKEIVDARTGGLGKANPSAVGESTRYYDPFFQTWPDYDPKKAEALLKEAGYKGQRIELQVNKRYTSMYDNAVMIQAMLASAGLNVELAVYDWATQLNNYSKGTFQLQAFSYSARLDPALTFASLVSDKAKNPWAQWDDPKAIELLAEVSRSQDEGRRKEIFKQLHGMMAEQVPIVPLYFSITIDGTTPKVKGYKAWAAGKPIAWGVWKE